MLELLKEIDAREDEGGEPAGEKTIVFSQFTTMLDLIELFIKDAGISFARCEFLRSSLGARSLTVVITGKMTGLCPRTSARPASTR